MPHGPLHLKAKLYKIVTAYFMEFATTLHPPLFMKQSLDIPNYMIWATSCECAKTCVHITQT